ncbi:MAG: hypothetical protein QGG36_18880 [Pirellulaceae bacterium]|nr:hypothetical protein [Pirellulaceae bacterium]
MLNLRTCFLSAFVVWSATTAAAEPIVRIASPLPPPAWALLQRQLITANEDACEVFFNRYFDERGWLLCVERWGGDDGPDDAIENVNDWPILHALGASDEIHKMAVKAWEGHLRQYTLAKTTDVPFARDGMYYKEFPVTFDWVHNGEGLTVFNVMGLSDPYSRSFQRRTRRFAGFYMNEDPGARNYDDQHKIIRSLFNGSRGPLLRKATAVDWAGDPIEVKNRFRLGHGEESYEQMLAHFKDYNDIVGDHPQNMLATSLALNAYMLSGENKYRDWLLGYVEAWRRRTIENGGVIPTNIGLDGKIGGATNGKWYGGVYGWAFSVEVPQDGTLAHRNTHALGFTGFMNAYMLTGDDRFLDVWRKQIDVVNSKKQVRGGVSVYPRMFGDDGWYNFSPAKYATNTMEIYYLSCRADDRKRISHPWLDYLDGGNPGYPERALRGDLERIRRRVQQIYADETTPDTRLADDPMHLNPASVSALLHLMCGGIHPKHQGNVLHARLRYFDPVARRAGIPRDVAALVSKMTPDSVTVTLVNTNQIEARQVVVQAGAYGEHQLRAISATGGRPPLNVTGDYVTVQLDPGAGGTFTISMDRYSRPPTMAFPWDRAQGPAALRSDRP